MLRATLRNLLSHKLRLVLSAMAVILGVSFVAGTFIFTDTLRKTFDDLFSSVAADVTVDPKQAFSGDFSGTVSTQTLPESMVDAVRQVDGVAAAEGDISIEGIQLIDSDGEVVNTGGAPNLGVNWYDDERLTPLSISDGEAPGSGGEIAVDEATADKGGFEVGDTVGLITPNGRESAELVGVFTFASSSGLAGATLTAFDTATAQTYLTEPGFTSVVADAESGVSDRELKQRVQAALGPEVEVSTAAEKTDENTEAFGQALTFINIILLVFAGISLFVGSFIILNTFSMLVAQRTRELALLRALGASRRQVTRSVLGEALVVGLLGGLIGLGLGFLIAMGLKATFAAFGLEIETGNLVFRTRTAVWAILLGVVVTVGASYLPARRASRVAPVAAMRDDIAMPARSLKWRAGIGTAVTALGVLALVASLGMTGTEAASTVGIGVFLTIIGAIALSPVLSRPVVTALGSPYPRLFGTVGRLARDNAIRNPRRTAATSSALMVGLALVAAFGVLAASINTSISSLIDRALGAEFVASTAQGMPFPAAVGDEIAEVAGVESVARQRWGQVRVGDNNNAFVNAVDAAALGRDITLEYTAGSARALADGIQVDETTAEANDYAIGDEVELTFIDGSRTSLPVTGIFEVNGALSPYAVSLSTWEQYGGDPRDAFLYIGLADSVEAAEVQPALDEVLARYPNVTLMDQDEFTETQQGFVNQLLGLIYALLGLAIIIAVLGIVNTLALAVIERTREIGLLRAVGLSRRQLRRMVRLESVVIAVYGAVLGLVLGIGFGVLLQRSLATQGIDQLSIPVGSLVAFLVAAAVIGVLAAIWPARRAARLDVLRAVTTE